jgi:hypothetical protein
LLSRIHESNPVASRPDQPHLPDEPDRPPQQCGWALADTVENPVNENHEQASGATSLLVRPFEPTLVISRVKELLGLGVRSEAAPALRLLTPEVLSPAPAPAAPVEPAAESADLAKKLVAAPPPAASEAGASPADAPRANAAVTPSSAAGATHGSAQPVTSVADAFTALLAEEQGESVPTAGATLINADQMNTLVDEVTHRVLERLDTAVVRDRVDRIVLEVAERLVREEISRIRDAATAKQG